MRLGFIWCKNVSSFLNIVTIDFDFPTNKNENNLEISAIFILVAISAAFHRLHEYANDKHFDILQVHCLQLIEIHLVLSFCPIRRQYASHGPVTAFNEIEKQK